MKPVELAGLETGPKGKDSSPGPRRTLAGILLLAILWYLGALLGGSLFVSTHEVFVLWPPSGIGLAALLLFGRRLWPGVLLGAAAFALHTNAEWPMAAFYVLGALVESLGASELLRRAGFRNSLDRIFDVLALLALAAFLATCVGTLVHGTGILLLKPGTLQTVNFWSFLRTHWFAQSLGVMVFAPLLLAWADIRSLRWNARAALEAVAILVATVIASVAAFSWQTPGRLASYPFLIFPFVIWAALRYGTRCVVTSILLVSVIGVSSALSTWGVFAASSLPDTEMRMLQFFLSALALTGLVLAATVTERSVSLARMKDSESRYRSLFERNPHPMFVFSLDDTSVLAANNAAASKLRKSVEALCQTSLDKLVQLDSVELVRAFCQELASGQTPQARDVSFHVGEHDSLLCSCTAGQVIFLGKPAGLLIAEDVTEQVQTREALHDLEQKLTLHMQQTALGVIEWTPDFRILEWNPAAERIFGYTAHEAKGQRGIDLLVPESDKTKVDRVWSDLISCKGGTSSINANLTKSGREIICEWFNTPLVDRRGKVIGVESVVHDITHRERAEEALRESEEKFRNIIESSPMGIHIYEMDADGRLLLIGGNSAADRILGIEHKARLGQSIEEAFPMLAKTDIPERYREVARGGQAWNADQVTYVVNEVTGAYEVTAFRTAPGKVVAMLLDVTERRRAEDALRLREKAMEAITQGIVIHANKPAQDIPIIYVNPAFQQITGYERDEIIGKSWRMLYGEQTSADEQHEMDEAFFEMRSSVIHMQLYRKNGEVFQSTVAVSPIKDDEGRVTHFASVLSDVTAIKKLEAQFRQSQKMEAIGRLAGGVAHDFNNLLTAIIGYNDLVLNGLTEGTPLYDNAREIQRAAERATALTGQLLSFSRQQSLLPQIVNLNDIVTGQQRMLARLIGEGIDIRTELAESLSSVKCEPGQIEQVIMNMAINARDAMAGRGTLTIHTGMVSIHELAATGVAGFEPGNYVLLAISDTGCGMTREVREHLFEPFFTTKEKGKGTGLGLATCYGIIKQNGGDIRVQTEPGAGTTFEIYLPAVDASAAETPGDEPSSGSLGGSERILVVEDDAAVRPLTTSILESLGYDVVEASDGRAAISLIEEGREFDLVVTDVVMPNMGGKELADWLRNRKPGVRILFTSGYIESTLSRRDIGKEERFFLQKPFTPISLARKVRHILDDEV